MTYYDKEQSFSTLVIQGYGEADLICDVYNRFDEIKKIYPYSSIKTNKKRQKLTPQMCLSVVSTPKYEENGTSIIKSGAENLAKMAGIYGYSKEEFKKIQNWHLKAKEIHSFLKLAEPQDSGKDVLKYYANLKITEKAPFLGNLSQCCQVVSDSGETCVEYGLTSENSTFMTIEAKNKFYAQAWVWYNEKTKTICLDNIEIPEAIMDELEDYNNNNKGIFNEFFGALSRYVNDIAIQTIKKGYPVDKVTLGIGHNDFMTALGTVTKDISSKITLREDGDFGDTMSDPPDDYGYKYSDSIYGQYTLWRKDGFRFYNPHKEDKDNNNSNEK